MDRVYPAEPVNKPLSPVRLRMYFTADELKSFGASDPAAFSATHLSVIKYAGPARYGSLAVNDTMPVPPSKAVTGTESGISYVEFAIDGFSEFWIGMFNSTLPVELFDFSAVKTSTTVALSWSTITENDTRTFVVERSADGIHYTAFVFVPASGNSATHVEYQAEDHRPHHGHNHYRLKLVDLKGITRYTSELFVKW